MLACISDPDWFSMSLSAARIFPGTFPVPMLFLLFLLFELNLLASLKTDRSDHTED